MRSFRVVDYVQVGTHFGGWREEVLLTARVHVARLKVLKIALD